MKTLLSFITILILTALTGCAGGPASPPNTFEQGLYDVTTNFVPNVTSTVIPSIVTNNVTLTNAAGETIKSNWTESVDLTLTVTNVVPVYNFTPNDKAEMMAATAKAAGGFFGPIGELVGGLVGAIFAAWATFRSRKANKINVTLAQSIEVARKILLDTPQGSQVSEQFVQWLIKNQSKAGVLQDVAKIVDAYVDPASAQGVATKLLEVMKNP